MWLNYRCNIRNISDCLSIIIDQGSQEGKTNIQEGNTIVNLSLLAFTQWDIQLKWGGGRQVEADRDSLSWYTVQWESKWQLGMFEWPFCKEAFKRQRYGQSESHKT